MVWVLIIPKSISGANIPMNWWEDDERLIAHFSSDPALMSKNKNAPRSYVAEVSKKFLYPPGTRSGPEKPLRDEPQDAEWPIEYKTDRGGLPGGWRKLPAIFGTGASGNRLFVEEAVKDIIERLEPGVHRFRPVRIMNHRGEDYPKRYFTLLIRRFLNSFSGEHTRPGAVQTFSGGTNLPTTYGFISNIRADKEGLAFSRAEFGDAHLWRELRVIGIDAVFSDELVAELKTAGLKLQSMTKAKEVA